MYIKTDNTKITLLSTTGGEDKIEVFNLPEDFKDTFALGKYYYDGEVKENLDFLHPKQKPSSEATKDQLKFWLSYHNLNQEGFKSELLSRAQEHFKTLQDEQ